MRSDLFLFSLPHPWRSNFGPWTIIFSEGKLIFSSASQRTRCNSTLLILNHAALERQWRKWSLLLSEYDAEPGTCFYYWALKSLETFLLSPWASSCFGIVVAVDSHGITSAAKKTHVFTRGNILSVLQPLAFTVCVRSEQSEVICTLKLMIPRSSILIFHRDIAFALSSPLCPQPQASSWFLVSI